MPGSDQLHVGGEQLRVVDARLRLEAISRSSQRRIRLGTGPGSREEVARKLEVLDAHCRDAGRDPGELARSVLYVGDTLLKGDPGRFVEEMRPADRRDF